MDLQGSVELGHKTILLLLLLLLLLKVLNDHVSLIFFVFSSSSIVEAIVMDIHLESVSLHSGDCKSPHTLHLYRPLKLLLIKYSTGP